MTASLLMVVVRIKVMLVFKILLGAGTWVAQLVKCLTLDFGSGHDLMVRSSSPVSGSELATWSLLRIFSLFFLSAPSPLSREHVLSLKINKLKKIKNKNFFFLSRLHTQCAA